MKTKWKAKCIAAIPKEIHQEKYEQRIAEVAEVIYDLFRQLDKSDQLPEPIETAFSPSDFTLPEKRTGTHG